MVESNCMKMRRILSSLIALGIASLGSVSASACALVHWHARECATRQTKADCERMNMNQADEPPVSVSHSSKNCCAISEAPLPEAQSWAGSFAVAAPPALPSRVIAAPAPFDNTRSPNISLDSSPPPLQSLLCTFLI